MLVLLGPHGGLGWDNTQFFYRANWDVFRHECGWEVTAPSDFGSNTPPWKTFRCLACRRILPVDLAHVDHKHPRANLSYKVVRASRERRVDSFVQNGTAYTIQSEGSMGVVITDTGQMNAAYYKVELRHAPIFQRTVGKSARDDTNVSTFPPSKRSRTEPLEAPSLSALDLGLPDLPGLPEIVPQHEHTGMMSIQLPSNRSVSKEIIDVLENDMSNLQLLCSYCNVAKGNREDPAFGDQGARA